MDIKISAMIAQNMALDESEYGLIDELIPVKAFPKGTILLQAGAVAHDAYFVIKGCVRSYQEVDGVDNTTAFFIEGDAVASLLSYNQQVPANHYLACVEDSQLAVLNYEKEQVLYKRFPELESLCRQHIELEYGKQQEVFSNYLTKSPEERYLLLMETQPELLHRVPQYILATYLGVKPESLSRIRKRIAQRT